MTEAAKRPFPKDHPLREDRSRLETILDLMWWEILKVLHQRRRRRGKPGQPELALIGGASAEDVLQDALFGLLRYEPKDGVDWEALGVRIAQNKAKEALRKSRAYRARVDGPDIEVASLDVENPEGESRAEQFRDHGDGSFTEEQAVLS
jgi:DNA-directed RNA polymerase specialized sigma24 family protein